LFPTGGVGLVRGMPSLKNLKSTFATVSGGRCVKGAFRKAGSSGQISNGLEQAHGVPDDDVMGGAPNAPGPLAAVLLPTPPKGFPSSDARPFPGVLDNRLAWPKLVRRRKPNADRLPIAQLVDSGGEREGTMLENVNYNLMETITIISRSLHRYESYARDASESDCRSCQEIWRKIAAQRETELEMLMSELDAHIKTRKLALRK
jgi:hypothetical protein